MSTVAPPPEPLRWHIDLDRYLNPFLPASVLPRLPAPAAHFLGYRTPDQPPRSLGNLLVVFWTFIGIFSSLTIIGAVVQEIPSFRNVPTIVGSFGAAAVLDFYAIESPLAQPRNTFVGQTISSVIGISVCKLFQLSPQKFESVRWIAGSLACATATTAMGLAGAVHPPAGATALMAVMDDSVVALGWFFIAPVLFGSALMLSIALLINNIQRRFPYYWWSPGPTGTFWSETGTELEGSGKKSIGAESSASETKAGRPASCLEDVEMQVRFGFAEGCELVVSKGLVQVPSGVYLSHEEKGILDRLSQRL
ncbi:HPP family-domain-containing protein [Lasiosphaeria hispida]|uniref:HPP family-domain-containing protein n=1 Tax=Lasiosphaeria hispida TaxID=260671 RepID=A0AAJ0H571_9PEZI|nr:HPP family-domain-containing protein [Lasiosphaeria hispida]